MAWSNNLFYVAFLCQILLMSYYFPNKLLARMRHVVTTYPPTTHPKLYPKPIEQYKMAHLAFKYVSRFILQDSCPSGLYLITSRAAPRKPSDPRALLRGGSRSAGAGRSIGRLIR